MAEGFGRHAEPLMLSRTTDRSEPKPIREKLKPIMPDTPVVGEPSARTSRLSKRLRFEILRRDQHTCRYCRSTDNPLTVDHVVPVALGGSTEPENLVAACKDCNAGKSATSPDEHVVSQVAEDALRWRRAMELAVELWAADREIDEEYVADFDEVWSDWTYGIQKLPVPRQGDWRGTIMRWRQLGVPIEMLTEAAELALGNPRIKVDQTWRYFCGIVWRRVTELQDQARELAGAL